MIRLVTGALLGHRKSDLTHGRNYVEAEEAVASSLFPALTIINGCTQGG